MTIAAVAAVLDPALVILGGGIAGERGPVARARARSGARAVPVPARDRGLGAPRGGHALRLRLDGPAGRTRSTLRPSLCTLRTIPPVPFVWPRKNGPRPEEEATMKRWAPVLTVIALIAVACSSGSDSSGAQTINPSESLARPVTLSMWSEWTSAAETKVFNKIFDGFQQKYPWITGRQPHRAHRQQDHGRDQLRRAAGLGPVVRGRQRRSVVQHGRVDRHDALHQRSGRCRHGVNLPAVGAGLYELQRRPVRAAVPHRRQRHLLQPGPVQGGHHVAAEDHRRAAGRREEAHEFGTPTARSRSRDSCR